MFVLVLLGSGCLGKANEEDTSIETSPRIDREAILLEARKNGLIMDADEAFRMSATTVSADSRGSVVANVDAYLKADFKGWLAGALADVNGGGSYGMAHARFLNGKFTFVADLGNLPELSDGAAYQGWLVLRGDQMDVVNVGNPVKTDKGYANVFITSENLRDYGFYVLTLEPDDDNPSPAGHILEGEIK